MAEKHVHKVYGSFPPWGKSVEFPASGGGGGYTEEEALFDFFEVDLNSPILNERFGDYIDGYLAVKPWAIKAQADGYTYWKMGYTMPFFGHSTSPTAVMFKCGKGDVDTLEFFGALKSITASEFYSGEIEVF